MKELVEGFPEIASGGVCAGNMGFIEGWKGWMDIVAMSVKVVMQQGNKKPTLTSKDEVARTVLRLILSFRVLKSRFYRYVLSRVIQAHRIQENTQDTFLYGLDFYFITIDESVSIKM